MKISIITVCLNSEEYIHRNINSVTNQNYENFEHIFIDGLSQDNTCNVIRENAKNYMLISEKDKGIYNAMNKGIKESSGGIICFLNSDDYFIDSEVLTTIAHHSSKSKQNVLISCGIEIANNISSKIAKFKSLPSNLKKPIFFNQLPHPGLFIKTSNKKDLFFDEQYRVGADLKQQFDLIFKQKYELINLENNSTRMIIGGASSGSLKKILGNFKEAKNIYNDTFGKYGFIFAIIRITKNFFRRIKNIGLFISE